MGLKCRYSSFSPRGANSYLIWKINIKRQSFSGTCLAQYEFVNEWATLSDITLETSWVHPMVQRHHQIPRWPVRVSLYFVGCATLTPLSAAQRLLCPSWQHAPLTNTLSPCGRAASWRTADPPSRVQEDGVAAGRCRRRCKTLSRGPPSGQGAETNMAETEL